MNKNDLAQLNKWEEALSSPLENAWLLIGEYDGDLWHGRMVYMGIGGPAHVAFDAAKVIEQEEREHNVIGFLHTHPSFSSHYSSRDDRTMKSWCLCLGKPLVCCIKGTDGLTAWWYMDDETPPEDYQVMRVKKLLFGVTPALYEYETGDPVAGLKLINDPDFNNPEYRPVEEFIPQDEQAEWHALQKQLKETNNGEQQIPS